MRNLNKIGNALGIGKAEEDNGILLLISKEDTKVRLETVKASTEHEKAIVGSIANASSTLSATLEDGTVDEITEANTEVSRQINNVLEVARKYPEIKTGEQFISLMDQIEGSINRISVAREEYNEEISSYNKMVKRFPGNILAGIFGYEEMEQFEADEEAKKTILIDWTK